MDFDPFTWLQMRETVEQALFRPQIQQILHARLRAIGEAISISLFLKCLCMAHRMSHTKWATQDLLGHFQCRHPVAISSFHEALRDFSHHQIRPCRLLVLEVRHLDSPHTHQDLLVLPTLLQRSQVVHQCSPMLLLCSQADLQRSPMPLQCNRVDIWLSTMPLQCSQVVRQCSPMLHP